MPSLPRRPDPRLLLMTFRSLFWLLFLAPATAGAQAITEYPILTPGAGPISITTGPDGSLWFTEFNASSNNIGRITTAGVITEYSIPGSIEMESAGIVTGSDGNLWFTLADFDLGEAAAIGRITPDGAITEFPLSNPLSGPLGIAAGSDGNLWFTEANINGNKIGRITLAGVITEFPIPTQGYPAGIAAGPDANLWFTHYANKIGRITTGGIITEFSIPTPASQPSGITAGPDGNLWFTEFAVNKIGRITTGGIITEFSIPTPASQPSGITAGPDGNLWFTERAANKIGRITTTGVITEFPIPTLGSDPTWITAGPDGNLWFTELHGNKIGRITTGGVSPTCTPDEHTLCLNNGRFSVTASFQVAPTGPTFPAPAVGLTRESGYFWFFNSDNVELMIKVLDGGSINGNFWVFYGALSDVGYTITVTDTVTGIVKTYTNPSGTLASVADTSAFSREASEPEGMEGMPRAGLTERIETRSAAELYAMYAALSQVKPAATAGPCDSEHLCLYNGRFRVTVTFSVPSQGISGTGLIVPITPDTGYLSFFTLDNIDLVIKVLDGQAINGHFWVFYGALTNVEYTITVTDTETGTFKTYTNPSGQLASVADTAAF